MMAIERQLSMSHDKGVVKAVVKAACLESRRSQVRPPSPPPWHSSGAKATQCFSLAHS